MAKRLSFYDVKAKAKFTTSKYTIKTRIVKGNRRRFAVAKSPITGVMSWRVLPKK